MTAYRKPVFCVFAVQSVDGGTESLIGITETFDLALRIVNDAIKGTGKPHDGPFLKEGRAEFPERGSSMSGLDGFAIDNSSMECEYKAGDMRTET